jgi:hypothetical protein
MEVESMKAMPLQSPLRLEVAQRDQGLGHQLHETVVADQVGESPSKLLADMLAIVVLEVAVAGHVEADGNGHDFTQTQPTLAVSQSWAAHELVPSPFGLEGQTEVVNVTEKCYNIHGVFLLVEGSR